MKSSKPYLVRAIYEWITDNNLTPYVAVDTCIPETVVPQEYIENDRIVLDISPAATNNLVIGNDSLEFKARFSGVVRDIYIPITAVMVIYAQENNRGMAFPPEEYAELYEDSPENEDDDKDTAISYKKGKPKLELVTGGKDSD
jgi:stringent starvation protein B